MPTNDWNPFDDPTPAVLGQVIALLKSDTASVEFECERFIIAVKKFKNWTDQAIARLLEEDGTVFEERYLEKKLYEHCHRCSIIGHDVVSALESIFADERRSFLAAERITTADPTIGLPLTDDLEITFSNAQVLARRAYDLLGVCIENLQLVVHPHRTSRHESSFRSSLQRLSKHLKF